MKKVSIGTWAIPQHLPELSEGLNKLGFDGISLGGFPPYGAHPDIYDTPEKIAELVEIFKKNNLEVADFAIDLWQYDSFQKTEEWRKEFTRFLEYAEKLGVTDLIRVDTCTPPILPDGMTYDDAKAFFVKNFKEMAKEAAGYGYHIVWEFEPGFIINEPKHIIELHDAVDEPNFSLLFDTCHAYNCAVGHRHIMEGCELEGGIMEFIEMAKDRIGLVHVIDTDGTLNDTGTSTHAPFGKGYINFDEVIPALLDVANYKGDWWAIDLCEWPNAWEVTKDSKEFVDEFNKKFSK